MLANVSDCLILPDSAISDIFRKSAMLLLIKICFAAVRAEIGADISVARNENNFISGFKIIDIVAVIGFIFMQRGTVCNNIIRPVKIFLF